MDATKNKAINFTDFCKDANLQQIRTALLFYNKKFSPEIVLGYFLNWELNHDDSVYKNGKVLINKHSTEGWSTKMIINDDSEYAFVPMNSSCSDGDGQWQYIPKTMSEFISDVLRYGDFDLLFSEKAIAEIYGGNNESYRKSDDTFVIGVKDGKVAFIKTFDYSAEKEEAQKTLSFVQDENIFSGWYISACSEWIMGHRYDDERKLLISIPINS